MDFNKQSVQRLGFDAYASNAVVNLIEDGYLYDGYRFENDIYSVAVNLYRNRFVVTVRAYVESMGWNTAELSV